MNERVRELAEQAREYANSKEPYEKIKNKAWIDVYDEKFAELIVRECVEVVKWTPSQFPNDEYVKNIQEHFGMLVGIKHSAKTNLQMRKSGDE